jgi:cell division protein FtsB
MRRASDTTARERLWLRMSSALRDALPLGILAVAVVGVPVLVFEPQGLPRLRSLERDLEQVEAENRSAEREIARLRNQVKLLKDDLATVEKVARQELGLVRKSEIVLQLPKQ